jgi:Mor family transcriptional regulator
MAGIIKSKPIKSIFVKDEKKYGNASNTVTTESGDFITWNHFEGNVDNMYYSDAASRIGRANGEVNVFKGGLANINDESLELIQELIENNGLYRGEEHLPIIKKFRKLKDSYTNSDNKEHFIWHNYNNFAAGIKNVVIGSLLEDVSGGTKTFEDCVASFESKVAPSNYKRTSAPITQKQIKNSLQKVEQLGLIDSLPRRYAIPKDITVQDNLWVNADITHKMKQGIDTIEGLTDLLSGNTKKDYNSIKEVNINEFMDSILPDCSSIELLMENKHQSNLVSLVAPVNSDAPNILKWDNNFSWTYNGGVTDSNIKERVKKAGGKVDAMLRVSLSWFNYDDLDLHIQEPDGNTIYFGNKISDTMGQLDIDMNASGGATREAVENIYWNDKDEMLKGKHTVKVNNYALRETIDVGFELELEFGGETHYFSCPDMIRDSKTIDAFTFNWDGSKVTDIKPVYKNLSCSSKSTCVWGINTQEFTQVENIMFSPNYWGDNNIGNKHYFFMLKDCVNPDKARGLYNEYLKGDLNEHRKVFEVLGSKLLCEESNEQLSGLGFSSTMRNSIICRIQTKTDNSQHTFKINF